MNTHPDCCLGGFSCFRDTPIGKPPGVGTGDGGVSRVPDKPLEWAVGFFFGNTELSLELWNVIVGIAGFDDS